LTRFTAIAIQTTRISERDIVEVVVEVVVENPSGSRKQSHSGFLHRSAATERLV
jgi:hypothetical protein